MTSKKNSVDWISQIKESVSTRKSGTLLAKDQTQKPVLLTWEVIDPQSPRLNDKIRDLSHLLIESYTDIELDFAQKMPNYISQEMFLTSLVPLLKNGPTHVDWNHAKQEIKKNLETFFASTNWSQYAVENEVNIFVVAEDHDTRQPMGIIQFQITPSYAFGEVKVALYDGVKINQPNQGIEELLLSSLYFLIPQVERLFFHLRITHETAIHRHISLGFEKFQGSLPNWVDLEYRSAKSLKLQNTAKTFDLALNAQ